MKGIWALIELLNKSFSLIGNIITKITKTNRKKKDEKEEAELENILDK